MSGSQSYSWPIVPVQSGKGYAVIAQIDWSKLPGQIVFDFSTQGTVKQPMQFVGGALIDNSQNADAVFITGAGFQPVYGVEAGDIVTIPIVAPQYPVIMLSQGVTPSPNNTGLTTISLVSWELGLTKTAQFVRPFITNVGNNIVSGTLPVGSGSEVYTTAQAQEFFMIQNVGASGNLLVRLGNVATTPSFADSMQLVPLGATGKNTLISGEFGLIPSGNLWLGAIGGPASYLVWWR